MRWHCRFQSLRRAAREAGGGNDDDDDDAEDDDGDTACEDGSDNAGGGDTTKPSKPSLKCAIAVRSCSSSANTSVAAEPSDCEK